MALGGGSARGLAHVGVLRWLEEHHIPIDRIAGTSMGGLIGVCYATGMTPDEIEAMLADIDWNAMFEDSDFEFQSIRRKRDSRAYPSHLEFGLKNGFSSQSSLNSGQQVELLFRRVTAPYYAIRTFDELPIPFRSIAFDLPTSQRIVLDSGSLAQALRATMSLPSVFPPVAVGDKLLVDGGAIDNVPADVVRDMGADRVIAVNVGNLSEQRPLSTSLLGTTGSTLDAMMRANTLRGMAAADVVINVPLTEYGSLDWRRFRDLVREGYDATETMKAQLLPLALDQASWESWRAARAAARRRALPAPAFVSIEGAGSSDTAVMQRALAPHLGQPLDIPALDRTLTGLGGLGRYQALTWEFTERDGTIGLIVRALPKLYAPPFLFLAASLENTTSNTFQFGLGARYLAYDVVGSGSELRVDAAIGSNPSAAVALYRPLGSTSYFVEPSGGVFSQKLNVIDDHQVVASYGEILIGLGVDVGVNLGLTDEARAGVRWGHVSTNIEVGDPGFPEIGGNEGIVQLSWTHDAQDDPVIPTRGLHARSEARYFFDAPTPDVETERESSGVAQAQLGLTWFQSLRWCGDQSSVRRGRRRHIVWRSPAADQSIRPRRAVATERARHRRAAWRQLRAGQRWLPATGRPVARLPRRSRSRRRLARERVGFQRLGLERLRDEHYGRPDCRHADRTALRSRELGVQRAITLLHWHRPDFPVAERRPYLAASPTAKSVPSLRRKMRPCAIAGEARKRSPRSLVASSSGVRPARMTNVSPSSLTM